MKPKVKKVYNPNVYLRGFDYVTFLIRRSFIGQLLDGDNPLYGLLVPRQTALNECLFWSGQDVTPREFNSYLNDNDIFLGDLEDFHENIADNKQQRKEEKQRKIRHAET